MVVIVLFSDDLFKIFSLLPRPTRTLQFHWSVNWSRDFRTSHRLWYFSDIPKVNVPWKSQSRGMWIKSLLSSCSSGTLPGNHWVIQPPPSPTRNTKAKQGGNREHFYSLWYDPVGNGTQDLPASGPLNRYLCVKNYLMRLKDFHDIWRCLCHQL